jgi:hypothetical protein
MHKSGAKILGNPAWPAAQTDRMASGKCFGSNGKRITAETGAARARELSERDRQP